MNVDQPKEDIKCFNITKFRHDFIKGEREYKQNMNKIPEAIFTRNPKVIEYKKKQMEVEKASFFSSFQSNQQRLVRGDPKNVFLSG